jgi:ribose transport system substrate-binding protein
MKIRVVGLVAVGCVLALVVGCSQPPSGGGPAPAKDAKGGRLFGVSFQTMNNPFFVELNAGMKEVIEAHGDRLVTLDAQYTSLKQKNDISDLVLQGATAIFLNPVNWEGVTGSLVQAKQKNIPVVVVDAPVKDADLVLCQVASDNLEAGRLAARKLAEVQPESKIVILHSSVNKACIDRVDGFKEEAAKHPGMVILDTQEGKGTVEAALPVMRDLLARFPECNAVFPINDPSAFGAISAIESAGKLGKVLVVTVDGSKEAVEVIKSGKLLSSSAQFPREIGKVSAEKVYEHLEGKPVEKEVKIPVELVTKENADTFLAGKDKGPSK